jgi:DNA-binding CsgD family transcriptional regulator/tetratricopeptide (TPR) repeat protein
VTSQGVQDPAARRLDRPRLVGNPADVGTSPPDLVGRAGVLAAVTQALRDEPSLVVVEGEAGIGKTRLVREALVAAKRRRVLVAACAPWRDPFPLGPVVVGLRRLWQRIGVVELSPLGGALRPLFPEWADLLPRSPEPLEDSKEVRHRLLCALTELVERLEVDVLVVEDAHWADTATLEWLLMLTATDWLPDAGLPIVVTYRPTDIPTDSLLPGLLARSHATLPRVRIELEPLDVDSTQRLVGSMLRTVDVSADFASFLHDHTDGLPLAVEETVRLMRDRHEIVRQHGSWTRKVLAELDVPATVRDSVLERVERLAPDARSILWAAAILAEPADELLLTTVAGLSSRAGREGIRQAGRSGLLRQAGGGLLAFRHQLDAKAVEESIPDPDRWELNRRAAQALRQWDPTLVARLARHFREANDADQWCHYAEAATDLALASGDDHTAVATLLELLTTLSHPVTRLTRLTHKLGETASSSVVALGELVEPVIAALRKVLDSEQLDRGDHGELRLLLGKMLWIAGDQLAAYHEYEAAIPDLGDRPSLKYCAMVNLALPLHPVWPASKHLEWLAKATELRSVVDSPHGARSAVTATRATVLLLLGEEAGWHAIAEAAERALHARNATDQRRIAMDLLDFASVAAPWGRYDDARRYLKEAAKLIDTAGYQRLSNVHRVVSARIDWYTGVWHGMLDAASELAQSADTEKSYRLAARQTVGQLSLALGARATAEQHLRAVIEECSRQGLVEPELIAAPAALARLCLANGQTEQVLDLTAPVLDMIVRKGVWLWATDVAQVHVDALLLESGADEAEAFVRDFATAIGGRNAPAPAAALLGCQAALAEARRDLGRAAEMFADAATAWATMPRPYDEMLMLERQGRCLLAVDERDKALTVLSEVHQRMTGLGAKWDADRVAHVLRQHGVEVPRLWRRGRKGYGDQLSPRELEVVGLVARGLTNRQIAERLFISPKTVGRHLSAAMRKLGVSSRTAVAMAAAEAGLLHSDSEPVATSE